MSSSSTISSIATTVALLLFKQAASECAKIYIETAPVPLETCYWSSTEDSYGLYCVDSYNGTTFDEPKVLQLWFNSSGCPDGLNSEVALFYDLQNCTDDNFCTCSGSVSDCKIMTRRQYDYNTGFNPGCNFTYYIDQKFVYDECFDQGDLGSKAYLCEASGTEAGDWLEERWYTDTECAGDRKSTPSPSATPAPTEPCFLSTCDGSIVVPTSSKKKSNAGGVAAAIIITLLVLICCGVGIWWWMRQRNKGQVSFSDVARHGDDHGVSAQDIHTTSGGHADDAHM